MAFDYKKEYKWFYLPKSTPQIVTVPPMNYIAVRGRGEPAKLKTVIRHPIKPARRLPKSEPR